MLIYVPVDLVNLIFFFNSFTVWEFLRHINARNDDATWKLLDGAHIVGFHNYCSLTYCAKPNNTFLASFSHAQGCKLFK